MNKTDMGMQIDYLSSRLTTLESAVADFQRAFMRYSKRKHSDAHVLAPHAQTMFDLIGRPRTSNEPGAEQ